MALAMKKIIALIMVILGVQFNGLQAQSIKDDRSVILIDPGHGGTDSGAVSEQGLKEKDVVLDIARQILVWNKTLLENKYDIYLTRNRDTLISLGDRTKLAQHLKPDIFISLHCNHSNNYNAIGIEVYTYNMTDGYNELSKRYAKAMVDQLNRKLGFKKRRTKQANFQVLRETSNFCPAILLEHGYLSNTNESDYLESKEKRKVLALAILMAI